MKKVLKALLFLIFLGMILYALWNLYGIWDGYNQSRVSYESIAENYVSPVTEDPTEPAGETIPEDTGPKEYAPIQVDFEALKQEGPDIIGWIYCEDTPINYPIVYNGDNDYYLNHLPNGQESGSGSIFLDERNNGEFTDLNNILYGHNMKDGSMFGRLDNFKTQKYFDEHPVFYLLTPEKDYKIIPIGGYSTVSTSNSYDIPYDETGWKILADKTLEKSKLKTGLTEIPNLPLITLSTCTYDYDESRFILVGTLLELDKMVP